MKGKGSSKGERLLNGEKTPKWGKDSYRKERLLNGENDS